AGVLRGGVGLWPRRLRGRRHVRLGRLHWWRRWRGRRRGGRDRLLGALAVVRFERAEGAGVAARQLRVRQPFDVAVAVPFPIEVATEHEVAITVPVTVVVGVIAQPRPRHNMYRR